MRRLSALAPIMISILLGSMECRAQSATPETLGLSTLPANTPVKLRLKQPLYTKDAKPGWPVKFEVVENVVVNGQVVNQKGAEVTGSVRQVDRTGKGPAKLLIDLGNTQILTGETVRLVGGGTRTGAASDRMSMRDAGGFVSYPEAIPLLPVFLVMVLFQRKEALLHEGMREMAYVGENLALDPAKLHAAQASVTKPGYATVFFYETGRAEDWLPDIFTDRVQALDPAKLQAAVSASITKIGTVPPVLCGPVEREFAHGLAARLRPGQYMCRLGSGSPTTFEFEDGKEYYVSADSIKHGPLYDKSGRLEDWILDNADSTKSGTSAEWILVDADPRQSGVFEALNLENDRRSLERKIVDVTLPGHAFDLAPYRKEVAKHPKSAGAHFHLASFLDGAGELDEALQEYRQALALEPDFRDAHFGIARLYQRKGDCVQAIP